MLHLFRWPSTIPGAVQQQLVYCEPEKGVGDGCADKTM